MGESITYLTEDKFIETWRECNDPTYNNIDVPVFCDNRRLKERPLIIAINRGFIRVTKLLIENGANISYSGAFSEAVRVGNIEIIKLLLTYHANLEVLMDGKYMYMMTAYIHIIDYMLTNDINKMMPLKLPTVTSDLDFHDDNGYASILVRTTHKSNDNIIKLEMFFQLEQLKFVATVFYDKPTYVIMWITDWLFEWDKITDYRKIRTIEGVKNSISRIKNV